MFSSRLRELRQRLGLTQSELAARAGVTRQLVGTAESGRHLPRVDAAAALASALGVTVEELLRPGHEPATGVIDPPHDGQPVHAARVDGRLVCAPADVEGEAWSRADGVVRDGHVDLFDGAVRGAVVAGCDPMLGLIARLLHPEGGDLLAIPTTSAAALAALADHRVHGAVVHAPEHQLPAADPALRRIEVARWQVGLAAHRDLPGSWFHDALAGRLPVIQRDPGATSQVAFERAATGAHTPPGPRATGHLDAAGLARRTGMVAVTIEPAAAAFGLAFHPLEAHVVELRGERDHLEVPGVRRFLEELTGERLRRHLAVIGGYDLSHSGVEVAA